MILKKGIYELNNRNKYDGERKKYKEKEKEYYIGMM